MKKGIFVIILICSVMFCVFTTSISYAEMETKPGLLTAQAEPIIADHTVCDYI